jgi:hypothetical protein
MFLKIFGLFTLLFVSASSEAALTLADCRRLLDAPIYMETEKLNNQIKEFEEAINLPGISPQMKVDLIARLIIRYGEAGKENRETFALVDEILKLKAKNRLQGMNSTYGRSGKLEMNGFKELHESPDSEGPMMTGRPVNETGTYYAVTDPYWVPVIIELMKENKLADTILSWGVDKIRLVIMNTAVDIIPVYDRFDGNKVGLAVSRGGIYTSISPRRVARWQN